MINEQALTLEIRTGPPPPDLDSVDTGILLGKAELPASTREQGARSHAHLTVVARIVAAGTAGHFRLKAADSCIDHGTVGRFGDSADLVLNQVDLRVEEEITIAPRFVPASSQPR